MSFKKLLVSLVLSMFSLGIVHAAGSPMHEDFTNLIKIAESMNDAAKKNDAAAFVTAADEGSNAAKDQGMKGNSPKLQRISTKFKIAKKAVKAGDFLQASTLTEEAIAEMKSGDKAVKWGGSSE